MQNAFFHPPEVIVLGAAAIDLVARVQAMPNPDEIILAESYAQYPGGAAANVAVGLARLGVKTGFVGCLGDDAWGSQLKATFDQEGVDTRQVFIEPGQHSAACFIAVEPQGVRRIIALGGMALLDSVERLDAHYFEAARALYIGDAFTDVAAAVARLARQQGARVFLAPGGVMASAGLGLLAPVLALSQVLILSRSEALALAGETELEQALPRLAESGPEIIVTTLGSQGALLFYDGETRPIPPYPVSAMIDTTGAGDALAAGVIAGYLGQRSWPDSVRFGCAAAALKIAHSGAQTGLPDRQAVNSLMEKIKQ